MSVLPQAERGGDRTLCAEAAARPIDPCTGNVLVDLLSTLLREYGDWQDWLQSRGSSNPGLSGAAPSGQDGQP